METTSLEKGSQNGQAERPRRTLKEQVRCLPCAAGTGVECWPDALIHATWLLRNRTHHIAIDIVVVVVVVVVCIVNSTRTQF